METSITYILTVFMGFFAVMNPIANTPIFVALTEGESKEKKKSIARTSTITAFIIVTLFIICGKFIFELFGITIPAFKITGGILLFYVGFEMLMSQKSKVHNNSESNGSNVAISPLAIPILAGPGTIVTAMNYVTDATYIQAITVIAVFGLMILLTYITFSLSDSIVKKLGNDLISVISKLMGLILAIIGTEMTTAGIKLTFF